MSLDFTDPIDPKGVSGELKRRSSDQVIATQDPLERFSNKLIQKLSFIVNMLLVLLLLMTFLVGIFFLATLQSRGFALDPTTLIVIVGIVFGLDLIAVITSLAYWWRGEDRDSKILKASRIPH